MRRNRHRKLSASIYHHAKNVGFIGILPYPEIKLKRKSGNRRAPLPFRGKRAEKLSQEIMRRNYHRKLSASIYHHAKNVGIIGIQQYPYNSHIFRVMIYTS